uniref:SET domain-containing protein n=1 Tax=Heterorhabditis bacteriophora TaxID=37862 RepID=A0A1I7XC85_HETBA
MIYHRSRSGDLRRDDGCIASCSSETRQNTYSNPVSQRVKNSTALPSHISRIDLHASRGIYCEPSTSSAISTAPHAIVPVRENPCANNSEQIQSNTNNIYKSTGQPFINLGNDKKQTWIAVDPLQISKTGCFPVSEFSSIKRNLREVEKEVQCNSEMRIDASLEKDITAKPLRIRSEEKLTAGKPTSSNFHSESVQKERKSISQLLPSTSSHDYNINSSNSLSPYYSSVLSDNCKPSTSFTGQTLESGSYKSDQELILNAPMPLIKRTFLVRDKNGVLKKISTAVKLDHSGTNKVIRSGNPSSALENVRVNNSIRNIEQSSQGSTGNLPVKVTSATKIYTKEYNSKNQVNINSVYLDRESSSQNIQDELAVQHSMAHHMLANSRVTNRIPELLINEHDNLRSDYGKQNETPYMSVIPQRNRRKDVHSVDDEDVIMLLQQGYPKQMVKQTRVSLQNLVKGHHKRGRKPKGFNLEKNNLDAVPREQPERKPQTRTRNGENIGELLELPPQKRRGRKSKTKLEKIDMENSVGDLYCEQEEFNYEENDKINSNEYEKLQSPSTVLEKKKPGRPLKRFRGRYAKQQTAERNARMAEEAAIEQGDLPHLDLAMKHIEDPTGNLDVPSILPPVVPLIIALPDLTPEELHDIGELLKDIVTQVCLEEIKPKRKVKTRSRRSWIHLPDRRPSKRKEYRRQNVPPSERSPSPPPLKPKPRGRNALILHLVCISIDPIYSLFKKYQIAKGYASKENERKSHIKIMDCERIQPISIFENVTLTTPSSVVIFEGLLVSEPLVKRGRYLKADELPCCSYTSNNLDEDDIICITEASCAINKCHVFPDETIEIDFEV